MLPMGNLERLLIDAHEIVKPILSVFTPLLHHHASRRGRFIH